MTMTLQERPEAILPTMGGQTALNLAKALSEVRHASHISQRCSYVQQLRNAGQLCRGVPPFY